MIWIFMFDDPLSGGLTLCRELARAVSRTWPPRPASPPVRLVDGVRPFSWSGDSVGATRSTTTWRTSMRPPSVADAPRRGSAALASRDILASQAPYAERSRRRFGTAAGLSELLPRQRPQVASASSEVAFVSNMNFSTRSPSGTRCSARRRRASISSGGAKISPDEMERNLVAKANARSVKNGPAGWGRLRA
jgi:hypothetical protein